MVEKDYKRFPFLFEADNRSQTSLQILFVLYLLVFICVVFTYSVENTPLSIYT